jgi:hypothetical protein
MTRTLLTTDGPSIAIWKPPPASTRSMSGLTARRANRRTPWARLLTAELGPIVAALYGERFRPAGYGLIVDGLAPGTYDLVVFAWSNAPRTIIRGVRRQRHTD